MANAPGVSPWEPLDPVAAADLFASFPARWWIAGGWTIDLFVGRQTRTHADTDILIHRRDFPRLYAQLPGWEIHAAGRPPGHGLEFWPEGRPIPDEVHDIWCRPTVGAPWGLQFMLLDTEGDRWIFRRDRRIGGSLSQLDGASRGIPFLAPEIQLLYKSKQPRTRDEADLRTALPHLEPERIRWLADTLRLHDPANPWIAILDADATLPSG